MESPHRSATGCNITRLYPESIERTRGFFTEEAATDRTAYRMIADYSTHHNIFGGVRGAWDR